MVGEELHADRPTDKQTEVTKLTASFCNFAKALETPTVA
jgi:hypothetical protein